MEDTRKLESVYDTFRDYADKYDMQAKKYFAEHKSSCDKFSRKAVPDWLKVDRDVLDELVFGEDGFIAPIADAFGPMRAPDAAVPFEKRWRDEMECRRICDGIRRPAVKKFDETRAVLPELRERFFKFVGFPADSVFNRIVAALRIDLAVPVVFADKAFALREWLIANGLMESAAPAAGLDWFDASHDIRECLYAGIPDASSYERSVFSIYLAECIAGGKGPRYGVLRKAMKAAGLDL